MENTGISRKKNSFQQNTERLRGKAVDLMRNFEVGEISEMSPFELKKLIYEMQVQRVELEMQNEELIDAQAQYELLWNEYSIIYDFAPMGFMTLDKNGVIEKANSTAARMTGLEKKYIIGNRFTRFVRPESMATFSEFYKQVIRRETKSSIELEMVRRDGERFFGHIECTPVITDQKTFARLTIVDITEKKMLEHALTEARESISRIVAERTGEMQGLNEKLIQEIARRTVREQEMENLIGEMKTALEHAKKLRGIFELCVGCKSLREQNQEWTEAETFLLEHSEAVFKHSVCPKCTQHLNPKILSDLPQKEREEKILRMNFKEFCDKEIGENYGPRFWRWFVNAKKSYNPMFPTQELLEFTVQMFVDDSRALHRIKGRYEKDETLLHAKEVFAKYALFPFGE